jgi:hypothetical protein
MKLVLFSLYLNLSDNESTGRFGDNYVTNSFIIFILNQIRAIKSRKMRWQGHVALIVDMGNTNTILFSKYEWNTSHRRRRIRSEDTIKTDLTQYK